MQGFVLTTKKEVERLKGRELTPSEWDRFCHYLGVFCDEALNDTLKHMTDRGLWEENLYE